MNVSAWSIRNPIPAAMLFVMLTLAGLMSFQAMKIQSFPDIELPTITVSASLPGAAPPQLETEVARKIENTIATLQGLKNQTTTIQDGMVSVTAEFRLEKPIQEALDDVRNAVAQIRSDLPADLRLERLAARHMQFGRTREQALAWIAQTLGHVSTCSFLSALDAHREVVAQEFDTLLGGDRECKGCNGKNGKSGPHGREHAELEAVLTEFDGAVRTRLAQWGDNPRVQALRDDARGRRATDLDHVLVLGMLHIWSSIGVAAARRRAEIFKGEARFYL